MLDIVPSTVVEGKGNTAVFVAKQELHDGIPCGGAGGL
jgi:hypothetical protein